MQNSKGKVVVITGASSGMGKAIAINWRYCDSRFKT